MTPVRQVHHGRTAGIPEAPPPSERFRLMSDASTHQGTTPPPIPASTGCRSAASGARQAARSCTIGHFNGTWVIEFFTTDQWLLRRLAAVAASRHQHRCGRACRRRDLYLAARPVISVHRDARAANGVRAGRGRPRRPQSRARRRVDGIPRAPALRPVALRVQTQIIHQLEMAAGSMPVSADTGTTRFAGNVRSVAHAIAPAF
jgi:hypothetical protein